MVQDRHVLTTNRRHIDKRLACRVATVVDAAAAAAGIQRQAAALPHAALLCVTAAQKDAIRLDLCRHRPHTARQGRRKGLASVH